MNPLESAHPEITPANPIDGERFNDNESLGGEIREGFAQARLALADGEHGKAELLRSLNYDRLLELEQQGLLGQQEIDSLRHESQELFDVLN